jgi:uncharacterized membrane protein
MKPERLNAFSDGVIAVIITIMVLELKIPRGADLSDLIPLIPVFFSYVLSFVYIAIYWNNHHHMMHASARVDGSILWSNMNLLFWLSLIPFATGWMGENNFARIPTATYGLALLMPSIAYFLLQRAIIRRHGPNSVLAHAIGRDFKGKASPILYAIGMVAVLFTAWIAGGIYVLVTLMWVIPDRRIERAILKPERAARDDTC